MSTQQTAEGFGDAIEVMARIGYGAKAVVYALIGVIALRSALGAGRAEGQEGVFRTVLQQPFGQILLAVVIVGLVAYALWRMVQATADPDAEGSDTEGAIKRVAYAVSGLVYASFAVAATRLLFGIASGGDAAQDWTALLMAQPFGVWLVGAVALILLLTGLYQFYRAVGADFMDSLARGSMSDTETSWARRAGRFGFAARGVVYLLIGVFLLRAALQTDPQEAGGLGEALRTLGDQPYGPWLLGVVAGGLIVYALFALVLARYRRIDVG